MVSSKECRALHLSAILHIRNKKNKILNLSRRLETVVEIFKSQGVLAFGKPVSLDSRHFFSILDANINKEKGFVSLLIGNSDSDARDTTYASQEDMSKVRHFLKEEKEGVFSSAHLLISLYARNEQQGIHPAVLEEASGINRSRVSSFLTNIFETYAGNLYPDEDGDDKSRPILKLDAATDADLKSQADQMKIKSITVSANDDVDPTNFFEVEKSLQFKVTHPAKGLAHATEAIDGAKKIAEKFLPSWKKMKMQVQRPDGHLVTIRSEGQAGDKLADAFQKIDTFPLDMELKISPNSLVDEVVSKMSKFIE